MHIYDAPKRPPNARLDVSNNILDGPMPNLAYLTNQQLKEFNRHMERTKAIVRRMVALRKEIEEHLVNQAEAGINGIKPDDFAARDNYLTTDDNSLTNQDWNRAHNIMEDVYAFLNSGNDIDGAAHTDNYTDAQREGFLFNIPRFNLN